MASCGAWSCFDEFHRIDIQVLSVIAHQILSIQRAIQAGMTQMSFEDSEIKISVQCAVFVTTESLQVCLLLIRFLFTFIVLLYLHFFGAAKFFTDLFLLLSMFNFS